MNKDLIETTIPLVNKVISDVFPNASYEDVEDYFQEGCLGLCEAVKSYDPTKSSFGNYAYIRIKGRILDYARKEGNLTRGDDKKLKDIERSLYINGKINIKNLNKNLKISNDKFYNLIYAINDISSYLEYIHSKYYDNTESCFFINEYKGKFFYNYLYKDVSEDTEFYKEIKTLLFKSFEQLTNKERNVILLRYFYDLSFTDISKYMSVTISAISHMHKKALKKIKSYFDEHKIEMCY